MRTIHRLPVTTLSMLALTVAASLVTGCSSTNRTARGPDGTASRPAVINHLAFFKLKNPGEADELIADCDRDLGTLPMVIAYYCGRHLDTGRGERVDSDYDVGFYVGFATEADYSAYVAHPKHQSLVAKWQPRWVWIRVQDVQDQSP